MELPVGPPAAGASSTASLTASTPIPPTSAASQLENWLGWAASQKIMGEGGYVWPAIKSLDPLVRQGIGGQRACRWGPTPRGRGNVVDWPNTPGMNQGLTDMQYRHGADLAQWPFDPVQDYGRAEKRKTRPPTTTSRAAGSKIAPKASQEATFTSHPKRAAPSARGAVQQASAGGLAPPRCTSLFPSEPGEPCVPTIATVRCGGTWSPVTTKTK